MEYVAKPVWLDPAWLSWEARTWLPANDITLLDSSDTPANDTTTRLYEIHQHACDRLRHNPNEFDRVDAITTLRRVVAQRVKALKDRYQLRELPTGQKPRGDLELLSYFGIIRPFMLKRLIDIRNIVEHQASSPPPTDECLMFADLVWYFLRSTDKLIRVRIEEISFEQYRLASDIDIVQLSSVTVKFWRQPCSERPEIFAHTLDQSNVDYEPRANWMKVNATKISRHEEERINPPLTQATIDVFGDLSCADEQMKYLYDRYFKVSHFS